LLAFSFVSSRIAEPFEIPAELHNRRRASMTLGTILVILLILILLGALPSWPYSRGWGYYPSGLLGVILVIVIILLLVGRL
jgi:hypothetical protein